jgi:hypothetical protein
VNGALYAGFGSAMAHLLQNGAHELTASYPALLCIAREWNFADEFFCVAARTRSIATVIQRSTRLIAAIEVPQPAVDTYSVVVVRAKMASCVSAAHSPTSPSNRARSLARHFLGNYDRLSNQIGQIADNAFYFNRLSAIPKMEHDKHAAISSLEFDLFIGNLLYF